MKNSKTFQVSYTKANGSNGTILVKAQDESQAIKNAQFSCFTGKDFRNPVITEAVYSKPSKQGFSGSHSVK